MKKSNVVRSTTHINHEDRIPEDFFGLLQLARRLRLVRCLPHVNLLSTLYRNFYKTTVRALDLTCNELNPFDRVSAKI